MKRRLTLSILGIVAATLVIAGFGTLLFARVGARNAAEQELKSQADSTADLVEVGQSRAARISNNLQSFFCGNPDLSGLNAAQQAAFRKAKNEVCSTPDQQSVTDAQSRVCTELMNRFAAAYGNQVSERRKAFCANPNTATLDAFQSAYCASTVSPADGRNKARLDSAKRVLCNRRSTSPPASNNIEETLSKEEIVLVEIQPDGTLAQGRLPSDLDLTLVDPTRLRNDETVSGSTGGNVFAAAPVGAPTPPNENVRAILIERPANTISDSLQWFLMAAGFTLVLGAVVAAWLSRALTNPLRRATNMTKLIADGDLSSRLPEHPSKEGKPHARRDELDDLAQSINSMADSLERSRGLERQFLLSVSHDLRTPLTSIRGYAEAIADGAAPDPQQAASVIMGESRRLERLVKDLLDLAKLESREFSLQLSPVDIVEVADDSVEGFRREVEAAGLRLDMTAPPAPVLAQADPDRLQQVIANLIENALKHANTAIAVTVADDTLHPRIEVADDGPGFAPEDLPHVFERLYVASHEPKRKETGSGLGLAIVRELVGLMGGHVRAEANPAGGARMVVELRPAPAAPPSRAGPAPLRRAADDDQPMPAT